MLAAVVMRIAAGVFGERMPQQPARVRIARARRARSTSSKFLRASASLQVAAPSGSGCSRIVVPKPWHETQRALPARFVVRIGWTRAL